MPDAASASGSFGAPRTVAETKKGIVHEHAKRLHALASTLEDCNGRLGRLADRLFGPIPTSSSHEKDASEPVGVIHVATFAAERISREIERLNSNISRLEELG